MSASQCPKELLDEIFSAVENHKDLVNLACTSRFFASLVIPQHTEYRIIKTAQPIPAVWAHLARRPDLSGNIREVRFVYSHSFDGPTRERIPTSLIDEVDEAEENKEEKKQIENVCKSLAFMKQLTTFVWLGSNEWEADEDEPLVIPFTYQLSLLKELTDKRFLVHLGLSFAMLPSDGEEGNQAEEQDDAQLMWDLPNLKYLDFDGDEWLQQPNRHILKLFQTSTNSIRALAVPGAVLGEFALTLQLPALEVLSTVSDHIDMEFSSNICQFLLNHPSITNLSWWFPDVVNLASGALPNLKIISGRSPLLYALEEAHRGTHRLKIQSLRIAITVEQLNELTCLDRQHLCWHMAGAYQSVDAIYRMAELFPSLMEVYLPHAHWRQHSGLTVETYFDIVKRFQNIERISGDTLYMSHHWDPAQIREHILKTAGLCPRLKEMDSHIRPIYDGLKVNEPLKAYIVREKLSVDLIASTPAPTGNVDVNGERISYQIREIWSGRVIYDSTAGSTIRWNSVKVFQPGSNMNWFG